MSQTLTELPARTSTLADFRDVHRGETVVVCGCGESLNRLEYPERFVTIGVNDIGRKFDPTYLVVLNPRQQFAVDRFRYVEQSRARHLFTQLELGVAHPAIVRFRLGRYGGTTLGDPDVLHYTRNSPYVAVCLAAHMGARRIGLIGVDFTDNHFFGVTGTHPLTARLPSIDAEYTRLRAALDAIGVTVINLSPASRLTAFEKGTWDDLAEPPPAPAAQSLRVVSYATTPVAGVPAILSRCIGARTPHASRCVWARRGYGNGVTFEGGLEWSSEPHQADEAIAAADVVIVHNGKVDPRHESLLASKPIVTLAHNYIWNVDRRFERRGMPALVVGQYQATLPEFSGWTVVPNPIPAWEPEYSPGAKPDVVTVCYTPSGRHERFPAGHRLFWHGKGYATTMRVLERLAATVPLRLEVIGDRQVPHAEALAMKQRAHIVIDECVTGSYHRNSLEGLAAGCVVVNGVGLLPGVAEALRRCAPEAPLPFVFGTLETLEDVLRGLVERGAGALAAEGRANRAWMERHWDFAAQWNRVWLPAVDAALSSRPRSTAHQQAREAPKVRQEQQEGAVDRSAPDTVSVVIPHGGADRLGQLTATLAALRQRAGVGEVIVAEMGERPFAASVAERWADKHLFIEHPGAFERARALNAGAAVAECEFVLWHDNDLLIPPLLIPLAVKELCARGLDYLIPYTSVRYLSEPDSLAVMRGERSPEDCDAVNTFYSARPTASCSGGIGLVRREFLTRHGGLVEGFRGWGGEDNAWNRKITLLGRSSATGRTDQHVHHLHHRDSGGYVMQAAMNANPHYSENVSLLTRVWAERSAAQFAERFPARPPATGTLTRSNGHGSPVAGDGLPVWTYWEGPCPEWIRACRRTITAHAPRVRLLTPESFDRLRDRDRDIDLSGLLCAHRADYVRAFLLQRYGGLWIDADCVVMQPLQPVMDLLNAHEFIGHRERVGLISNGFIASRPGSRIASGLYDSVCRVLRTRRSFHWNALGADPLSTIVAADPRGFHELPCDRVQPICWSHPEAFFALRERAGHDRVFDPQALCYMLSNSAVKKYLERRPRLDLLADRTFFTYLLRRSIGLGDKDPSGLFEAIFAANMDLYRRQHAESLSGPGSTVAQTQELRERLPLLVDSLGVESLLDAPCGDLNWMQHVRLGVKEYIGVDIIGEIVAANQWRHASAQRRFQLADVTRDQLPRADAILCRDLFNHLAFADVFRALANFKASGARYLVTTTFTRPRPNLDTAGGEWRTLNLTLPPFGFPPPIRMLNEKCTEAGGAFDDKSLGVWLLRDLAV